MAQEEARSSELMTNRQRVTLLALTSFRPEELAVPQAPGRILRAVRREREKLQRAG